VDDPSPKKDEAPSQTDEPPSQTDEGSPQRDEPLPKKDGGFPRKDGRLSAFAVPLVRIVGHLVDGDGERQDEAVVLPLGDLDAVGLAGSEVQRWPARFSARTPSLRRRADKLRRRA
jgi:hypothetical protein